LGYLIWGELPVGFNFEKENIEIINPFTFICKNKQVPETNEIRRSHYWEFTNLLGLSSARSYIYCYRGIVGDGAFMDTNSGRTNRKEHHPNSSHIHPSSRSLFRIVYYRSRPITSLEHIQCTNLVKWLWSVLQSVLRNRHVVWRDGD
jgi:hypothetical protein